MIINNPMQQIAIDHKYGPLLVLAGAGSGKTSVVTQRIARLIEQGVSPTQILAVTFTNKAAGEMRERVIKQAKTFVLTCTFHSLGAKILRESIAAMGYKSDFVIYDENDSLCLIKNCFALSGIKEDKSMAKKIKGRISGAKNDLVSPAEAKADNKDKEEQLFLQIYPLYQSKLKEYNALDFDDLLFLTVKLLENFPAIQKSYQDRWQFVLIDEYQDTNMAQYRLAKILVAKHQNICAVGDPDQSIYAWRGAKYQNILNFDTDFPSGKTITLERNYRSTNNILKAANALITHNPNRYKKELWSALEEGDKISLLEAETEREEAYLVAEALKNCGYPWHETAIFYRTNAQSRLFEDMLLRHKIPYVIYGGISFYQRREIKDILSFLRLLQNGDDMIAFERVINLPKRGIGPAAQDKLRLFAEQNRLPVIEAAQSNDLPLSAKQKEALKNFSSNILSLRAMVKEGVLMEQLLEETILRFRYLEYLKEEPETREDREENISQLIAKASEFESEEDKPALQTFLEELSLMTSAEEDKSGSTVKLMTLHNSKGLEFNVVFMTGMEEGLFPHGGYLNRAADIEEERRLCYVGITRAKKKLYLLTAATRFLFGTTRMCSPSRFLKEIPGEYLEGALPAIYTAPIKTFAPVKEEKAAFALEAKVRHERFGIGIIKKIYSTTFGTTYDIFFQNEKEHKTLVGKYAKLEKV